TIDTWWGLVAPASTPKSTIEQLNAAFSAALESETIRKSFKALLAEPVISKAPAFDQFMAQERARYEPIVKATGAK
ncbi:tripartite tricarboxylate transporter substrate binding protein, partial [Lampropedia aestuarii]